MKILLLNPPDEKNRQFIREGRCMQTKSSWAALWMPLSLAYLAAILEKENYQIKLVDCIAEKINFDGCKEIFSSFLPDFIVINTGFPSIDSDMKSAALAKKVLPDSRIAVFGIFPTLLWKKCLEENPAVDFCVAGEPEWTIQKLAEKISKKEPLENIKGLAFRKNNGVVFNGKQDFRENEINSLPLPARRLLRTELYRLPIINKPFTLINIARGCPYDCSYCIANVYYGKIFRKKEVEKVVDEIEHCQKKMNISHFLFWGESFTLDQAYGEKICDEIIRRKLNITWSTTSRIDTLNPLLLGKMKKAGCEMLGLGIESTDDGILNNISKRTTFSQIKKAVEMVRKSGIKSMGHFIFGLPGETKKTAEKTIDYALKSGIDYAQFYCAVPYPETKMGIDAKEKGWVDPTAGWADYDLTKSIMRNESLSSRDIKTIRDRAYKKFYFRPKILLGAAKEATSVKAFYLVSDFLRWVMAKDKKS